MLSDRLERKSSPLSRRRVAHEPHGLEPLERRQFLSTTGPEDAYEDNDLPRITKARVKAGLNSPNLGLIQGEKIIRQLALVDSGDVYRIRTSATGTSADFIRLNFGNANGNLDLKLFGASGTNLLRSSLGNTGTETISLNGLAAGTYFVRVEGKNGQTNAVYRLTFKTPTPPPPPPPPPADDPYEENDTLQQVGNRAPGLNSPNLGDYAARTVSGLKLNDTYDIFRFKVTSKLGFNAFVQINSTASLDMVLFNSAGRPIRSSEAYLGQRGISFAGLVTDTYYLQVTHYALGATGPFNYALVFGT